MSDYILIGVPIFIAYVVFQRVRGHDSQGEIEDAMYAAIFALIGSILVLGLIFRLLGLI